MAIWFTSLSGRSIEVKKTMIKIQENETDSSLMYNWNVLSDEKQGTIYPLQTERISWE